MGEFCNLLMFLAVFHFFLPHFEISFWSQALNEEYEEFYFALLINTETSFVTMLYHPHISQGLLVQSPLLMECLSSTLFLWI